jgi:hypothetical protein
MSTEIQTELGVEVTRTKRIYKYSELSDEAKRVVLDKQRQWLHEEGTILSECAEFDMESTIVLALQGTYYEGIGGHKDLFGKDGALTFHWDLGYSQGSGACFTGTLTRENAPALDWPMPIGEVIIKNSGHYCHYNSPSFEFVEADGFVFEDEDGNVGAATQQAMDDFEDSIRDLFRDMELAGYRAMEFRLSDEAIEDDIGYQEEEYRYEADGHQVGCIWWK